GQRYQDALSVYDKIIQRKPDYYAAWIRRGMTFEQMNCYQDANSSYGVALEMQPNSAEAVIHRNRVNLKLKNNPH
ncbi:MAG: tetratricopeptide repeat protein, partial [Planktothrix sp.]